MTQDIKVMEPYTNFEIIDPVKILSHEDYVCPFCSHGETIKFKIYLGEVNASLTRDFYSYLECGERCFRYCLIKEKLIRDYEIEDLQEQSLDEALKQFSKLIEYSKKNPCNFIMVSLKI